MKAKYLWVVLITLVFFGCDDNTGNLGVGMLPDSDGISVQNKTFPVYTASSSFEDFSVFAKTNTGYVGRFTDNEHGFGYYEGSFLTELNCVDNLTFPKPYNKDNYRKQDNMIGDIDKAFYETRLTLSYYSFFGDSLKPVEIGVYELENKLQKNHYTSIDPDDYTPNKELLGKKTFSAVNLADSTRHDKDYRPYVTLKSEALDELGKRIIQQNWNSPTDFDDSDTFIDKVFKGVYIKNEAGDGVVLYVKHVTLNVLYKGFVLDSIGDIIKKKDGSDEDSTYIGGRTFAATMEVIQANQIKISETELNAKIDEDDHTYLKSPAGIYTKAKLPISQIMSNIDIKNDTINAVKLEFTAYHHETESEFSMSPPQNILLIREKEIKTFFENNKLPDSKTSYLAGYSNNKYTFSNITRLVNAYINEMEEAKKEKERKKEPWNEETWLEDNQIAIIPVSTTGSSTSISSIQHDLKPAFVKLKGGIGTEGSALDLKVTYSSFNEE